MLPGDLPLGANAAIFAASAAIVGIAGTRLARYADAIASRMGIGQAPVGALLLGGVTSLPELAVAVTATTTGHPELSVNDVLGSASINVLLLALADVAFGRGALTSTLASPAVVLQGLFGVLLFGIVAAAVVAGDVVVLGMGISSWLLVAGYAIAVRMIVHAKERASWTPSPPPRASATGPDHDDDRSKLGAGQLAWRTALAAAAILVAGFLLARTGAAIADQTGLGTNFVGAVMLAFATSLPEVVTVLAAVRLKRYEMAMADVFGTNLFNVMIIVIVDQLHDGKPILVEVGAFAGFGALLAGVLSLLFLIGMIERRDRTMLRMGIDSLAALGCYVGGLAVLYHLR